jgi:hypothetical protein
MDQHRHLLQLLHQLNLQLRRPS